MARYGLLVDICWWIETSPPSSYCLNGWCCCFNQDILVNPKDQVYLDILVYTIRFHPLAAVWTFNKFGVYSRQQTPKLKIELPTKLLSFVSKSSDIAIKQLGFLHGFRQMVGLLDLLPRFRRCQGLTFGQVGGPLTGREGTGGLLAQFEAPEVPRDFYSQVWSPVATGFRLHPGEESMTSRFFCCKMLQVSIFLSRFRPFAGNFLTFAWAICQGHIMFFRSVPAFFGGFEAPLAPRSGQRTPPQLFEVFEACAKTAAVRRAFSRWPTRRWGWARLPCVDDSVVILRECNGWLVVWLPFFIFPYIGNVIIPIDVHIFQRGGPGPPTRWDMMWSTVIKAGWEIPQGFHGGLSLRESKNQMVDFPLWLLITGGSTCINGIYQRNQFGWCRTIMMRFGWSKNWDVLPRHT